MGKELTDKELKELTRKRGEPSYHKDCESINIELYRENGLVTFHCISCDVHILIGQLDGFD